MKNKSGLNRLLNLIPYLNSKQGEKVEVVCRELGISVKQLLADIRMISSMSYGWWGEGDLVDIYLDHDRIQVYTGGLFEKVLRFTQPELAALLCGWDYLKNSGLKTYLPGMESALKRIRAELAGGSNMELEAIQDRIQYQPTAPAEDAIISKVLGATEGRRGLMIMYYSVNSDSCRERDVDPWHCVCRNGIWYLIAMDHGVGSERIFRVDRISELKENKRRFQLPENFHAEEYINEGHFSFHGTSSRTNVRIRLGGTLEKMALAENWGGLKKTERGWVLEMKESNGNWILNMLLPFCDSCEILDPPDLRRRMRNRIRDLRMSLEEK